MNNVRKKPLVSILILSWNGKDDTVDCLESLRQIDYPNYKVILVDNGSSDGLAEIIHTNFSETIFIRNKENLGFAGGNNIGIRYALSQSSDYVLLLNNDTIVHPSFLSKLVDIGEEYDEIGMLSPIIYYDAPSDCLWFYRGEINWKNGFAYHCELDDARKLTEHIYDSEYLAGCSLLVKRQVIESIGLLDQRFFAYYEDVDWCLRCKRAGWKITVVPSSIIWHKLSSHQNSDYGTFLKYRNAILLLWKHSDYIRFVQRVRRHIYKALAEYSWDRERHRHAKTLHPMDGVWAGLTCQYGAYRGKMPIWAHRILDHTIRYWLLLFRFPR